MVSPARDKECSKSEIQDQTNDNQVQGYMGSPESADLDESMKMDGSLVPGNAYVVRVMPATSGNEESFNLEVESDEDAYAQDDDEAVLSDVTAVTISEDEEYDLCSEKEEMPEKRPETEVVTYLACDTEQKLANVQKIIPELAQSNSAIQLTENLDLKEALKICDIIEAAPLVSKVVKMSSKRKKSTDMLYKLGVLERKVERFRKQRKIDKNKIKTLFQAQRRNAKKVAALKESLAALKTQKSIAASESAVANNSFTLLDLIDGPKYRQVDKNRIIPNEYSAEIHKFSKTLYNISRGAYMFVRNYFGQVLPHDGTISKWTRKERRNFEESYEES